MGIRKKIPDGTMLAGYPLQIVRRIGTGGMAIVYEALDTELGLPRAVKVLDVGVTGIGGKDPVEELRKEARVMARLHQRCKEHVVQVLFVGRTKDENHSLFIVMDRLIGCSLKELLSRKGALPWVTAKQVVQHIAEALAVAHEDNIVHRDVKPANIFCDAPPERRGARFVLLDFGIAAILDSSTNRFKGTFKYAAPEQTKSPAQLLAQTDVYSLGVVLYEMLAGRHPFAECANDGELIRAHRDKVPRPLSAFVEGAPPSIDALLAAMLAKDPAARPSSMRAVEDAIYAIHWDDRRTLKPPSDVDTTVEEIGTAVQNVEDEHEARAVPIQLALAATDPALLPEDDFKAPNVTPSTLESRFDRDAPPVFRKAISVAVLDPPSMPATPKMHSQDVSPPPRKSVLHRLPDVTEPMYNAPPRPAKALRNAYREDTFEPVDLPMHWSGRRSTRMLAAALVFAGVLLSIGFVFRGRWAHRSTTPAPSATAPIAVVPSPMVSASAMKNQIAVAPVVTTQQTATVATPPVVPTTTAVIAPSSPASISSPVRVPRRPVGSTASATPAVSHDPDAALFKNHLPGSGL